MQEEVDGPRDASLAPCKPSHRIERIGQNVRGMARRTPSLVGIRIGQYDLQSVLGSGAMGDVYRAVDTKLNRPVAIKVLADDLASPSARRRFQREAQLASSLNHPHILTVHDVGEYEDRQYLVTEFVDSGTLREWALSRARTWRQILDVLVGVADALATAHDAGILHRDVKPANILVATNGYAKLADFGLAKLHEPAKNEETRTIGEAPTKPGVVIGTIAYMSPEQAAGRPLDARSDIFSFGVVLYELLAGRRPFDGGSDLEVLQRIIHGAPPPLTAEIPVAVRLIVEKALEQDPADRYQSMREMVVDMRRTARRKPEEQSLATAARPARWWVWIAGIAVAVAAIGGAVASRWWARPHDAPVSPVVLQRITDFVGTEEHPAISPDGKTVAFVAPSDTGRRQIWVRLLAGGTPLQITHDEADHEHPRWTPDSSALIYRQLALKDEEPGALWEIAALGGTPRRITASQGDADISHDGRRIATFQSQSGRTVLAILERNGSVIETKPLPALSEFSSPRWSPDDRSVAFVGAIEIAFNRAVYVIDLAGGDPFTVASAPRIQGLAWLPDNSGIVYASSVGSTAVYPPIFNLRTAGRRPGADERQLTFGDVSYVEPDIVAPGKLFASRIRMQSDIWRFPVGGSPADNVKQASRITNQTGQVQTPSPSPDDQEVVYLSDSGGHMNVWVTKVDGSSPRQITFEKDPAVSIGIPIWSPSGDRIVFVRSEAGVTSEWLINPDGGGLRELVRRGAGAAWSPDGRWLYYFTASSENPAVTCIEKIPVAGGQSVRVRCEGANMAAATGGSTLFYVPSQSAPGEIQRADPENGPARLFIKVGQSRIPFLPQGYALSPDDGWLAMPLRDSNTTNIWAFSTKDGAPRQLTDFGQRSTLIARQVSWSRDGRSVYAAVVETDADIVLLDGVLR
jgi:eukaryotic-like serine/threonine-protein kinase